MALSHYLIAVFAAWVVAQGSKYIVATVRSRSLSSLSQLYMSGNMPSAHSASAMALLTVVAYYDGIHSGVFAVAALFASIVMYDAVMVRRSSGEQGAAIKSLIKESGSKITPPRVAKGHTPLEVLMGALLGVVVGLVTMLLF